MDIPLPPAFDIPQAFVVPEPILAPPQVESFKWEPVPMYIETTPQAIPTPQPRPKTDEEGGVATEEDEADDTQQSEQQEKQASEQTQPAAQKKSETKPKVIPASGKPIDIKPPTDLVPEIAEVQTVALPIIGVEVPLPRTEILVTATTTAGVSSVAAVGGTLFATTMFRQLQPILKPIFKTILKKLAALRKKPPPRTWARERLLQKRLKAAASHPGK